MSNYNEIKSALEILEIKEKASIRQIEKEANALLHKWHPDKCKENSDECIDRTKKIISARKILIAYCKEREISFKDEDLKKNLLYVDYMRDQFYEY